MFSTLSKTEIIILATWNSLAANSLNFIDIKIISFATDLIHFWQSTAQTRKRELLLNVIIPPPPAHCHRAGFGHRIENGLVRVAPNKIVPTDRQTDMKIAYAQLHIYTNIMYKF